MENEEVKKWDIAPELAEIFDLASLDDGAYSARWVPGGIQLVHTNDTKNVVKEYYWPEADAFQKRLLQLIMEQK